MPQHNQKIEKIRKESNCKYWEDIKITVAHRSLPKFYNSFREVIGILHSLLSKWLLVPMSYHTMVCLPVVFSSENAFP